MRKLVFIFIPFLYLLTLFFTKDLSMVGDLGRHLKLGEIVLRCFCVPQTNLFSYTNSDFPIVNHEWFGEVLFYIVNQLVGLHGLLIFKMFLIFTATALLFVVALKKGSFFWVIIFSLLCITVLSTRFFVLPELFSYFFIALFIYLIEKFQETKRNIFLYLLPFLEILWVNSHIYFILGIGIYMFFLIEKFSLEKKINLSAILVGITLVFSTLLNPSFTRGALLPFTFSTNYNFNVEENISPLKIFQPTSTNSNIAYTLVLQIFVFGILIILFGIGLFLKIRRKNISQSGNGMMAAFLGLRYTRCVSLLGLLGFIPLVESFTTIEKIIEKQVGSDAKNLLKGVFVLGAIIIVLIHLKGVADYQLLDFNFVPSAENAVAFIKANNLRGNIFNNYVVGNYLIYGLYPQEKVYIDARPEAYPGNFFNNYWRMLSDTQFFNQQVVRYNINAVVFNVAFDDPAKIRPFLIWLLTNKDWVPVYADGTVTIAVKNNNINKDIIDKYRITLSR